MIKITDYPINSLDLYFQDLIVNKLRYILDKDRGDFLTKHRPVFHGQCSCDSCNLFSFLNSRDTIAETVLGVKRPFTNDIVVYPNIDKVFVKYDLCSHIRYAHFKTDGDLRLKDLDNFDLMVESMGGNLMVLEVQKNGSELYIDIFQNYPPNIRVRNMDYKERIFRHRSHSKLIKFRRCLSQNNVVSILYHRDGLKSHHVSYIRYRDVGIWKKLMN